MRYTLPSPVRMGWLWYKLMIYLLPSLDAFLSVFLCRRMEYISRRTGAFRILSSAGHGKSGGFNIGQRLVLVHYGQP